MSEYVQQILESGLIDNPDIIYRSTIPELSSIVAGKKKQMETETKLRNIYAGTITAAIYNVNRGRGKPALKWSDVFRDPAKIQKPVRGTDDNYNPMDPHEAYNAFKALFSGRLY